MRIDPNFEPRPDVCATRTSIRDRYPTGPHAIEIVVEILSPEDKMAQLLAKCQHYMNLGIAQVFVADPETETAWQWNPERRQLDRVDTWTLTNGETIHMADVWAQMHQRS